jgi:hypothetical protein
MKYINLKIITLNQKKNKKKIIISNKYETSSPLYNSNNDNTNENNLYDCFHKFTFTFTFYSFTIKEKKVDT